MKAFLSRTEDQSGFPSMEFEDWYQQGMSCYLSNLPTWLRKQAFSYLVKKWQSKGLDVEMWHIRAFVHGATGFDNEGHRIKHVSESFTWPTKPDAGWQFIILCYPDGLCDFDYAHPVSRKFWSEDNDFLSMPHDPRKIFDRDWFEKMGFEVMMMHPAMLVTESAVIKKHLQIV